MALRTSVIGWLCVLSQLLVITRTFGDSERLKGISPPPLPRTELQREGGRFLVYNSDTNLPVVVQQSHDFSRWDDLNTDSSPLRPSELLRISKNATGTAALFFRARSTLPIADPAPISTNDVFYPYLTRVPPMAELLSESQIHSVRVRRFRFHSFAGTSDGGVSSNQIYAVLAIPLTNAVRTLPGILIWPRREYDCAGRNRSGMG
jgi:hypothetical protein